MPADTSAGAFRLLLHAPPLRGRPNHGGQYRAFDSHLTSISAGCCTPYPYEVALAMLEIEEEVCGAPAHPPCQPSVAAAADGSIHPSAAHTPTFRTPWMSPSAASTPLGSPRRCVRWLWISYNRCPRRDCLSTDVTLFQQNPAIGSFGCALRQLLGSSPVK